MLPKGVAPERRRYLDAELDAALRGPELVAEYRKTGAIVERKLATAAQVEAEVEKLAGLEREFFVNTGRLPK